MIQIWAADISPLLEKEIYEKYYQTSPKFRRDKADKIKTTLKKAQSIGVWALWSEIKSELNLDQSVVTNFSHSGNYALCAVQVSGRRREKIGCDIEALGSFTLPFVQRFFCQGELDYIYSASQEEEQIERFFRYWVLKESFMKATGRGMAVDTRSFEIALGNPGDPVVFLKKPKYFEDDYFLYELDFPDKAYKVACCTTDLEVDVKIKNKILRHI